MQRTGELDPRRVRKATERIGGERQPATEQEVRAGAEGRLLDARAHLQRAEPFAELDGEPNAFVDLLVATVLRRVRDVGELILGNRALSALRQLDQIELVGVTGELGGHVEARYAGEHVPFRSHAEPRLERR